jgi:6,7-dimethyl-8-ribityllumazine synthase
VKSGPEFAPELDASGLRIAIVAARFNHEIVGELVAGAREAVAAHGAAGDDVRIVWVPGAFELPVVLERLAAAGDVDVLVTLGCVVRGDTPHFDYVAGAAATGCTEVALRHGVPVAFGVLTTDTWEQAEARAGGELGNKGAEAALSAIETARVLRSL